MRIEYFEPKLEIIDLLDADIVTASTETGDNGIGFGKKTLQQLLGIPASDNWDDSNSDQWN